MLDRLPALLVIGLAVGAVGVQWPTVGRVLGRVGHAAGRAVGAVLRWALLGLVAVVVLLPCHLLGRLLGREILPGLGSGRYQPAAGSAGAPRRAFTAEPRPSAPHRREVRVRRGLAVVGALGALVVLDAAVGWAWDPAPGEGAARAAPGAVAATVDGTPVDLAPVPYRYVLATVPGGEPGVRPSAPPVADGGPVAEVWFLGGAAVWGAGLAEEQTIPSAVSRRAGEEGVALQAVNLGSPGDVAWQELYRLEQRLAHHPPPAAVVFVDGADDLAVQRAEGPFPDPAHFGQQAMSAALAGVPAGETQSSLLAPTTLGSDLGDLIGAYLDLSAGARLVRGPDEPPSGATVGEALRRDPRGAAPPAVLDATARVYRRFQRLATALAARHGVATVFAWEPVPPALAGAGRDVLAERLGDVVVDLGPSVAGPAGRAAWREDGGLTDRGATLIAARIWDELRTVVARDPGTGSGGG